MKKITILGSTGSIGTQTLEIIRENKDIEVMAISAAKNIDLLEKQIREFKPSYACIYDKNLEKDLVTRVKDTNCKIVSGMEGLIFISTLESINLVVTAIVGMIGIEPTIAAIKAKKNIALANKETLVCAGHIIMPLAKEENVNIYPVDSEHSAIFQCLRGNDENKISKILLTASGGPFRGYSNEQLKNVTLEQALKHPNWSMGKKITIDSSTMVNKGLEVIEAKWLFGVEPKNIEVVVQPKSIIHSMVEFEDGAVMAQLGTPDMKLPIQYALYYPLRKYLKGARLDFSTIFSIELEKPDMEVFRGLKLAYEAIDIGGSMPTVYNAANELAVERFLNKKIAYIDIINIIENQMNKHKVISNPSLEDILNIKNNIFTLQH